MEYLIAVCSYEMEEFDRAEDILLRGCRNVYRQSRTDTSATTLDEWILSTSVSFPIERRVLNLCCISSSLNCIFFDPFSFISLALYRTVPLD